MNLPLFQALGFVKVQENETHLIGKCPFCERGGKLYISKQKGEDGLYDCKTCGRSGNQQTLLTHWYETNTTPSPDRIEKLAEKRGIPAEFLIARGITWCEDKEQYVIPYRDVNGEINNFTFYSIRSKKKLGLPGVHRTIYNIENLNCCPNVYICEGEFDTLMMEWQLEEQNGTARLPEDTSVEGTASSRFVAVGVPGAGTFKAEWASYFAGKNTYTCFDNDPSGGSAGDKIAATLVVFDARVYRLLWGDVPPKYDISNYFQEGGKLPGLHFSNLSLHADGRRREELGEDSEGSAEPVTERPIPNTENWWHHDAQPDAPGDRSATSDGEGQGDGDYNASSLKAGTGPAGTQKERRERPTFPQLIDIFRQNLDVTPEFENGLRIVFGAILSQKIPGDPVWLHFVGPSGSGKTEILLSAMEYRGVVVKDTLTPHTLVSGYKVEGGDPSLIPKLNGKTFILKDLTEVLALPRNVKDEIFSVLRGAYDGFVEKTFGNAVTRSYKTNFTLVAGVTSAIYRERNASLGERFLCYHMFKGTTHDYDAAIHRAMRNVGAETQVRGDIRKLVAEFLHVDFTETKLPALTTEQITRIVALANIVSILRGSVEVENFTNRLQYRPQTEVGTRVAKQLKKLALGLSLLEDPPQVTEKAMQLVTKTALDTCIQFNFDILKVIMHHNSQATPDRVMPPLVIDDIQRAVDIPLATLRMHLEELIMLGAIEKRKVEKQERGRPPFSYHVSEKLTRYWKEAQLK